MAAMNTAARAGELKPAGTARAPKMGRRRMRPAIVAAVLAVMAMVAAPAAVAGPLSISKSELQRFSRELQLTRAQTPQVNAITVNLVRENSAIFQKYGVDGQSCSDLGPFRLSALNNEVMAAYSRARGQLSQVLSPAQLQKYGAMYNQRRQATKQRIVCGTRQAQR
jgi:hypothetical protein